MQMIDYKRGKLQSQSKKMLISKNYVEILKHELDKRIQKNARYSMRAFAKHLGISPSSLSNILTNKKGLSERVAQLICKNLEFSGEETDYFCALVNSVDSRSRETREKNKRFVMNYLRTKYRIVFGDEDALLLSELRNLVLLEILKISKVKAPLKKSLLSQEPLIISTNEQQKIIDLMIHTGMVEINNGYYEVKHETFLLPDKVAKEAQKNAHFKALEYAKHAYENEHYDEREFYLVLTPLNRSSMKEIKSKIREFADELMYKYGTPSQADSVYGLCTYLFPLEKNIPS
jgi:uncharacterized protein (TIGR02147 family)